jgi:hypothetical protein
VRLPAQHLRAEIVLISVVSSSHRRVWRPAETIVETEIEANEAPEDLLHLHPVKHSCKMHFRKFTQPLRL